MSVDMARISIELAQEVSKRLADKDWSHQRACVATGVNGAVIGRMALGIVPGADHVINWALGLRENVNYWLVLARYDPIPEDLICDIARVDRVREDVTDYLIQHKTMSFEEIAEMFKRIGEAKDIENQQ
jgi:hypothetical protein